jgi:hypothetical protein
MKKRLFTALAVLTGLFLLSGPIVWAQSAPVAKTGQTTSYVTGDDGYYQKGVASPSPRFTDNGDGTVTDNLTGLMWAKDANDNGTMTWQEAIDYTNNLSLGTSCGSPRTDWRLPNIKELKSMVDYSNYSSALPTGHPFTNVQSSQYWTSSTAIYDTGRAWYIYMGTGVKSNNFKTILNCAWPVRGDNAVSPAPVAKTGQTTCYDMDGDNLSCTDTGQDGGYQKGVASPSPRFTDNGDGTVTDALTGLMWAKDANLASGMMYWQEAIDYANNLSLGTSCGSPRTDWRLPNIKELKSLIDYSNSVPALPTGHLFTNVQSLYHSSSTYAFDTGRAWYMMNNGRVTFNNKTNSIMYVWPVRSAD